jgi:MerR family transcriptional regulator/heat shock protein HspR
MKKNTSSPKENNDSSPKGKSDIPLYPISIASELVGTTDQTLRLYEKHGLIQPSRRNKNRFYSENDIIWLKCIRELIHDRKISIEGIKKLLDYAPCWEILDCKTREKCSAYRDKLKDCWEMNKMCSNRMPQCKCEECIIYLSHIKKKNNNK